MKEKKNNSTKKVSEKANKKPADNVSSVAVLTMENKDFRNAVLTTSLLINLFFLTAWVAVQVSSDYAHAIGAAIFNL